MVKVTCRVSENVTKEKSIKDKDAPRQDFHADTQTVHLSSLCAMGVTPTGSFDVSGQDWMSTFAKVVQAMPVPVLLISEDRDVIVANEACSKINPNYRQMENTPFSSLFVDPVAAKEAQALLEEVFRTKKPRAGEGLLKIGSGRIWGRMTYRPIRIADMRLVLLVVENLTSEKHQILENQRLREELEKKVGQCTIALRKSNERLQMEVAEQKRTREALNRSEDLLKQVFNTMSSGVLVLDNDGNVLLANKSAVALLHLDDNIIGQSLNSLLLDFDISRVVSSSIGQTEARLTLRDGTTRFFTLAASPLGAEDGLVIVFQDMTAVVESQQRRRRADELALVGEMISRLSHEIKNPLASIVVGLKTLRRGTPRSSEAGVVLALLSNEVDDLTKTVNQLLESARLRPPAPRPVYIEPLLERCMDANGLLAVRRGVGLELVRSPASSAVIVDDLAMLRVLGSLVQNALDACGKGDMIRIGWQELDKARKHELVPGFAGKVVSIFVEDNGGGIPDEVSLSHSHVFKAFVSTKISGSGLGLTVARDIVESHGGVILVDSSFNSGTRVEILLPSPEAIPCWDWYLNRATACPSPKEVPCEICTVRSTGTGHCCWTLKGKVRQAETGQWPDDCLKCGYFRLSSLTPFFRSRLLALSTD